MSSPTTIRLAHTEGMTAMVTTVFNQRTQSFDAFFQIYEAGANGATAMKISSPWSTEEGAIAEFDEWMAAEIGDMPAHL